MTRLGALTHPPFARLLSGQLVSSAGTQMSITDSAGVRFALSMGADRVTLARALRSHLDDRVLVHDGRTIVF